MNKEFISGIATVLFLFILFSWALGRAIHKHKKIQAGHLQHFLSGAWIIGLVILLGIAYTYYSNHF